MQYILEEESIGPNDQLWAWRCNAMDDYRFLARVTEYMVEPLIKKRIGNSRSFGDRPCLGWQGFLIDQIIMMA